MICGVLVWATICEVPRVEALDGFLESNAPVVKLISPQAGTVVSVHVREGESVRKGSVIAIISTDRDTGRGSTAGSESLQVIDMQERIGQGQILAEADAADYERSQKQRRLQTLSQRMSQLQAQLRVQSEIVSTAASSLKAIEPLAGRGLVTRDNIDGRRRTLLEAQKDLEEIRGSIAQNDGETQELRLDLARMAPVERARTLQLELARANLKRERNATISSSRFALVATNDGKLTGLQVAPGQTVSAGLAIATISPPTPAFHAEVLVPSRAVGDLASGQRVQLRLDSFPYEKFGAMNGTITSVSLVPLGAGELKASVKPPEPVYRANIGIPAPQMEARGRKFDFRSGMRLKAMVEVEHRTIASWLLPRN